MYGNQTFETEFAVQRAMEVIITSYNIDQPFAYAGAQMPISVHTMNETNAMVNGIDVVAYNNARASKALYPANDTITGGSAMVMIPTDSSSKEYTYVLSNVPVEKNSVTVTWYYMNNEYNAVDDGNGKINGTKVNGTINYATGAISLKFDMAPDLGFIIVTYAYEGSGTIMIDSPLTSSAAEYDTFILPDKTLSPAFGTLNILQATQIAVVPHQLFVSAEVTSYMVDLGGTVAFKATVTDENGKSFDVTVSATSTDGNIISVGGNEFILDTSGMDVPNVLNPVEVTLTINGVDGYLVGATKVTVLVRNMPPSLTISSVGNGDVIYANSLILSGYAYDSNGVDSVFVTVDGGSPQAASISVVPGGVQWSLDLSELSEGNHTITVVAEDSQGVQQSQTVTFEVKLINGQSDLPSVVQDMQSGMSNNAMLGYTGIILAIIALIIAIVAVLKKEEVPEETEEEVTEEEEVEEVPEETEEEVTEEEETPKEGGEE